MPAVDCPYCFNVNYTSYPEAMDECAYCGRSFAEADLGNRLLIVIDNRLENADQVADDLKKDWQNRGVLGREVIIDRRHTRGINFNGADRRQSPAGLTIRYRLT